MGNMMGFLLFAEVAQLKQFLPDPVWRIETCDLIEQSVTPIVSSADPDRYPLTGNAFARSIHRYRADCDLLLHLLANGVFHADGTYHHLASSAAPSMRSAVPATAGDCATCRAAGFGKNYANRSVSWSLFLRKVDLLRSALELEGDGVDHLTVIPPRATPSSESDPGATARSAPTARRSTAHLNQRSADPNETA
ncbi:hypothetical protein [Streptomyces sp. NPDC020571]|uniref:hypothetical protein n=1 Tax=Streptomyces sp. NPDC020571 TaxID=3365079 RepID=UPI0037A8B779